METLRAPGEPRDEVVAAIAADFNVNAATVDDDLASIRNWLPELEAFRDKSDLALIVELRRNRQRLHQLADRAHDDADLTQERKIRQEINRSINFERQLHERLPKTKATGLEPFEREPV